MPPIEKDLGDSASSFTEPKDCRKVSPVEAIGLKIQNQMHVMERNMNRLMCMLTGLDIRSVVEANRKTNNVILMDDFRKRKGSP